MNHALDSFGCLGSVPTDPLGAPGGCAEVSTDTADASLMRRVPSAPTETLEGLGKADKHMASETESHLSYIFGCETM